MRFKTGMDQFIFRAGLVICVVALMMNVTIYLFTRNILNDKLEEEVNSTTQIIRQTIESTQHVVDSIEHSIDIKLYNASKIIASELRGKPIEQISAEDLARLRDKLELSGISLFVKKGDDIVIVQSSDLVEIGLSAKGWGYWYTALSQLMSFQPVTVNKGYSMNNFWVGPLSNADWDATRYFKYGYYYDGTTPFMINPYIEDRDIYNLSFRSGPTQLIEKIVEESGDIEEIGVINVPAWLKGDQNKIVEPFTDTPVLYGTHRIAVPEDRNFFTEALRNNKTVFYEFVLDGTKLRKYYVPLANQRVLALVLNEKNFEKTQRNILVIYLASFVVASLLVYLILRKTTRQQLLLLNEEKERFRIAEEFKRTIEMLPDIIFKLRKREDGEIIVTYLEGTTPEELNITTERVKDQAIEEAIPQIPKEKLEPAFGGKNAEFLFTIKERVFKTIIKPVHTIENETISEVAGYATDITERIEMEKQLADARDEALKSAQVKSEFLATMSHEIRTPLNAIIGMSHVLLETSLTNEQKNHLKTIMTAGNHLLHIINDILDLSKIESGHLKLEPISFHVPEFLESTVQIVSERVKEKGLQLTYHIDADVPTDVVADPERIRQVLLNIIGNAIKFTESGSIAIRVQNHPNGALLFSVRDTGIGIAPEKIESIFDIFTQADSSITRRFGGTGLGLAISKRLVHQMGGEIWVDSQLGEGSTFYFTVKVELPEKRTRGFQASVPETVPADETPLHILLVDDSEDNRLLIQAYLKNLPYQIDVAENGKAAYEMFQQADYDLVLMDIQMPIVDGYTATRWIRDWERANGKMATPVIALTANALPEHVEKSLDAGCTAHISKPILKPVLLETIKQYAPTKN